MSFITFIIFLLRTLILTLFSWTIENNNNGTSLVVQWLRLHAPNARGLGSIPGLGTRSLMPQEYFLFYFIYFYFILFYFIYFLYSRSLLVINFIHISVYMSIPISQFITLPPPPPLSPLGVHTFVLYICVSISALRTGSSVPFF